MRARLRRVPLALRARTTALATIDCVESALGRRDPLLPPRHLRAVGAGDFAAVGASVMRDLIDVGDLRPDHHVLDVGCGVGRLAIPLTGFLQAGAYEGFDIAPTMIAWCDQNITPRFPHFRFQVLDVANGHYNPAGQQQALGTSFPYEDAEFDFALATSLFTHLLPGEFLNYVTELGRTLTTGGTFFGTFFLINQEAMTAMARGEAEIDLRHELSDAGSGVAYRAINAITPETAIGLSQSFVATALADAGFTDIRVHPGLWSGRPDGRSYQDIVVARRALNGPRHRSSCGAIAGDRTQLAQEPSRSTVARGSGSRPPRDRQSLLHHVFVAVSGKHPNLRPWHFQWLAGHILYPQLRPLLDGLSGDVLDVGCGYKPYRQWVPGARRYFGIDVLPGPEVDAVIADGQAWPVGDEEFDAVVCTQVLEHVGDLELTVREIVRVLRPGGETVISVPFIFHEHNPPHDYRRFSRHGARRLFEDRLEILAIREQGAVGSTLGAIALGWTYDALPRDSGPGMLAFLALLPVWLMLCLAVNLAGVTIDRLDHTGLYYGNVLVHARKPPS